MSSTSAAVANNKLETSIIMEDYVVIQQPDEVRDDDDSLGGAYCSGDDDASYDYCEDVFSHGAPDADDLDDDHSVTLSIGSGPGTQKDNIILTVPSILMKDLDEAHAAAELASFPDEENEAQLPSTVDTPAQEPTERVAQCARTTTEAYEKLKFVKKAQAAENAVQAVNRDSTSAACKDSKAKRVVSSLPPTARGTSRKVANIAVACARETMASYRQEVLCSTVG
jgi:hypothetical protein